MRKTAQIFFLLLLIAGASLAGGAALAQGDDEGTDATMDDKSGDLAGDSVHLITVDAGSAMGRSPTFTQARYAATIVGYPDGTGSYDGGRYDAVP